MHCSSDLPCIISVTSGGGGGGGVRCAQQHFISSSYNLCTLCNDTVSTANATERRIRWRGWLCNVSWRGQGRLRKTTNNKLGLEQDHSVSRDADKTAWPGLRNNPTHRNVAGRRLVIMFCFKIKLTPRKLHHFQWTTTERKLINGASVVPTSQVRTTAMLVSSITGSEKNIKRSIESVTDRRTDRQVFRRRAHKTSSRVRSVSSKRGERGWSMLPAWSRAAHGTNTIQFNSIQFNAIQ
jgi:hypothetical protein